MNFLTDLIASPLFVPALSAAGGAFAALITSRREAKKLESERQVHLDKLKVEHAEQFSIEAALRQFLGLPDYRFRSFQMIQHHIGGFEPNELRRRLVGSGAVRFMAADGTEMWALRERVGNEFSRSAWKLDTSPANKFSNQELFPGAFADPKHF